jgi:hypothetical protein
VKRTSAAPAGPADDSIRDEALGRLKARYGEARGLLSPSGDCSNLDWMIGAMKGSDEAPEVLNRKMTILLSLWLEDLAVELERARELSGAIGEAAAAAHRACESAATSLRQATTEFLTATRN